MSYSFNWILPIDFWFSLFKNVEYLREQHYKGLFIYFPELTDG